MTTKVAIFASIGTLVLVILISIVIMVAWIDPGSRRAEQQAQDIGQAMGLVTLLPLGAIWLSWASRVQKERKDKSNPPGKSA
jgi:H+/Cl- antiporter ClcA